MCAEEHHSVVTHKLHPGVDLFSDLGVTECMMVDELRCHATPSDPRLGYPNLSATRVASAYSTPLYDVVTRLTELGKAWRIGSACASILDLQLLADLLTSWGYPSGNSLCFLTASILAMWVYYFLDADDPRKQDSCPLDFPEFLRCAR
ncbi:hypothetical protein EDD18DRAFT_1362097 [Armillaria luteobubalina]|uniref:Uncharacterized protein n=1 Tax=Armillaria luteobubalina TaxID=153913 RepID=A0AA39PFX2_9AGAR|nr:hypothetical protein EDD18DRAFT_1362097 [Armillaria luteobubalina]